MSSAAATVSAFFSQLTPRAKSSTAVVGVIVLLLVSMVVYRYVDPFGQGAGGDDDDTKEPAKPTADVFTRHADQYPTCDMPNKASWNAWWKSCDIQDGTAVKDADECSKTCQGTYGCAGFVFAKAPLEGNNCFLKQFNRTPPKRKITADVDFYLRSSLQ